jgi:hypothetical protein
MTLAALRTQRGWIFTRGSECVRVERHEDINGCSCLIVHGPDAETVTEEFSNVVTCMKRQAEIEQHLLTAGYQLASASDRRAAPGIWQGADRRRPAH